MLAKVTFLEEEQLQKLNIITGRRKYDEIIIVTIVTEKQTRNEYSFS